LNIVVLTPFGNMSLIFKKHEIDLALDIIEDYFGKITRVCVLNKI